MWTEKPQESQPPGVFCANCYCHFHCGIEDYNNPKILNLWNNLLKKRTKTLRFSCKYCTIFTYYIDRFHFMKRGESNGKEN